MRKISKIILLSIMIVISLFTLTNYSFAVETNTGATNPDNLSQASDAQITTTVSSKKSANSGFFSATNIVNILLIAVGVVLIILAIAILLKIKK